jgi:hypothetical protein
MNERIKQLVIQADAWCDQNFLGQVNYDGYWEAKFAELIVRECAKVANLTEDYYPDYYKSGRQSAAVDIKNHFGVEE